MKRDAHELRRNLHAVCPTLSADDLGLIVECLGYELLGRAIWQGAKLIEVSNVLLGWAPPVERVPAPLPGLPLRQPR